MGHVSGESDGGGRCGERQEEGSGGEEEKNAGDWEGRAVKGREPRGGMVGDCERQRTGRGENKGERRQVREEAGMRWEEARAPVRRSKGPSRINFLFLYV